MESALVTQKFKETLNFFHPAGLIFIILFAVVTLLLSLISSYFFVLGAILTAWCAYFFRDPDRVAPVRPGLIVSPADGKVVGVKMIKPTPDLGLGEEPRWRISIFLNIFDVHVNRIPADGKIVGSHYRKGKFMNASLDKASEDNERMALVLQLAGDHPRAGQNVGVVQIAGLIARRIVCDAKQGDTFRAGERYGIIRFGSRAEIYLPAGLEPLVAIGQNMLGGETVLADCASNETVRLAEKR